MVFKLLNTVAQKLTAINVPYMLSGSFAMSFYAVSRNTRDIDIVAYLNEADIDHLELAFDGYYFHRPTVETEIKRKGMFNVISNETGFKIDFIILKQDEYSLTAFSRRKLLTLENVSVSVISIEDLIIAKLKWIQQLYSERQFSDIRNLLTNPAIDTAYMFFWVKKLNLQTFNVFEK